MAVFLRNGNQSDRVKKPGGLDLVNCHLCVMMNVNSFFIVSYLLPSKIGIPVMLCYRGIQAQLF
jgi:hypothetical protein